MKKIIPLILILIFIVSGCNNADEIIDDSTHSELMSGELIINNNESSAGIPIYSFDTFNPITTKSMSVSDATKLIFEPLFELNQSFEVNGVLASGYTKSEDGLSIVVYLKDNIFWHDGTQFTSNDIDYTVKSILQGDSIYKQYLTDVLSYGKDGSYKYKFTLKRPVPNFISLLTFPIVKNNTAMTIDSSYIPVGTGPYYYAGKGSAKEVILKINEKWHQDLPKIKNIRIPLLKDKETAIYSFEANEVDCITSRTLNLNKYTPKGQVNTAEYISNNMTYIGINYYYSPLWGVSTRQALCYLINKENIVNNILYNRAVAVDVPVNPSAWYYDTNSRGYSFDEAKASELLAIDGWKLVNGVYSRVVNGTEQQLKLEILVNSENEERINIANSIATIYNANGINATVKAVGFNEYTSLISSKNFNMFISEVSMPSNMDPTFLVGSQGNYFTYSNPQMDELINRLGTTNDESLKLSFVEFGDFFNKDIPFIPLFFRKEGLIHDTIISGDIRPTIQNVYHNISGWYVN